MTESPFGGDWIFHSVGMDSSIRARLSAARFSQLAAMVVTCLGVFSFWKMFLPGESNAVGEQICVPKVTTEKL